MATRKKSAYDIVEQYDRIQRLREQLAERDGNRAVRARQSESSDPLTTDEYVQAYNEGASRNDARDEKAFKTAQRYINNIRNSKSFKRTRARAQGKADSEKEDLRNQAHSRQYSRNTYMGLNKG